jgi:hypothetical protein
MSTNLSATDIAAAELLLEQGITLLHAYANRNEPRTLH